MNIHKNARLTPLRREEMALAVVEGGLFQAQAALKYAVTAKHIASVVAVSPATVSRVLRRAGLSRLKDIEPAEPVRRYDRTTDGRTDGTAGINTAQISAA